MSNNTFVVRLTRGAMASTIAAGCLVPEKHSDWEYPRVSVQETTFTDFSPESAAAGQSEDTNSVILLIPEPKEWTKGMEREFRQLALGEATGALLPEQLSRLEQLSKWRDHLVHPRTVEETLLQLKRDRLVEKISETLRQYVEFQQSTGKKRSATS